MLGILPEPAATAVAVAAFTGETVRALIGSNQDRRIEDDFHWCGR
jgi:hypothetical protein